MTLSRMRYIALEVVGWLICPTRKIVGRLKRGDRAHAGRVLRKWSVGLRNFDLVLSGGLCLLTAYYPGIRTYPAFLVLVWFAFSRVNEISSAFYDDAFSRLKKEEPTSDLRPTDRVRMAMRSYLGLLLNFAVLFYFLPIENGFAEAGSRVSLQTFFDSLYFSGVTLATLGYGDIAPSNPALRFLAVYEVLAGILLVAISIATYVSAASERDQ